MESSPLGGAMTEKLVQRDGNNLPDYGAVLADVADLIEQARQSVVRTVNASMTALYWLIGRRIVESENPEIMQTSSAELEGRGILQTPSAQSPILEAARRFSLPWSAYVRLLSVKNGNARHFYEKETLRGGWSVRQLRRQIDSQFYERMALSKDKAAMLTKGQVARPEDAVSPLEEIKDPYLLEFLDLKDEYSENDLEEALIHHLEAFLLELGNDFCFVGRQKRLRVGDAWYRVDLIFFHRRLRCLVVIDLKIGAFTHADAGQMHLYLNYAREHWTHEGENPPVGLILCAQKDASVAHYALDGLPNQVMASEYRTALPDEKDLAAEIERTRAVLEERAALLPEGGSD
jgi:predicted nuclease of restriction endonuclease-like (RecB) superfamily